MARAIYSNDLWSHPVQLRLFMYLLGKAIFSPEGVNIAGVHVPRGSYLASYRDLSKWTAWIENHKICEYGLSTVKRAMDELIKKGRIEKSETSVCTIWKIVNYDRYQNFGTYDGKNKEHGTGHGTPLTPIITNVIEGETDGGTGTRNGTATGPGTIITNVLTNDLLFAKANKYLTSKGINYSKLILKKRLQSWEKQYSEDALNEAFCTAADIWTAQSKEGNFLLYLNKVLQNDYPTKTDGNQ